MAVNRKGFTDSEKLEVRSWQLPDLEGPPVNEEDALGSRAEREALRQQPARTDAKQTPPADDEAEDTTPEIDPPSAAELQAIREAAREEGLQEGRQAGHDAGYAEGYAVGEEDGRTRGYQAGYEAGQEQARQEAETALAETQTDLARRFGAVLQTLNEHEQALEEELAPVVRDLILRLTQGLVVQALQQAPEQIEDIVHQAFQLMPPAHERMQIFLHPDDSSMLKGQDLHWLEKVELQEDDSLSPGGCLVKTRHSLLDYSLDARYQRQIQALLEFNNGFSATEVPAPLRQLSAERFRDLLEESGVDPALVAHDLESASSAEADSDSADADPDTENSGTDDDSSTGAGEIDEPDR